ncbi:hypothetical protein MCOR25_006544 [Pyricularia grisea]|nr:hypothetical protein MCOR25_006544 [Pyricularia grisea]
MAWSRNGMKQRGPMSLASVSSVTPRRLLLSSAESVFTNGAWYLIAAVLLFAPMGMAHEHHQEKIKEGDTISMDPIDTTLWVHIFIQMLAFGVLFPLGMVLGLVKSRWHVPVQTIASAIAILGAILGHSHGGREFAYNAHSQFGDVVYGLLFAQIVLGVYLKLHIERGFLGRIRKWLVLAHSINGKVFPVVSWVQLLFGGIAALGFCHDDHLGQCVAHFIMGSAFIAYGTLLTIMVLAGQLWLRRTGRSQEFFDSSIIAAWGCVNTFTEHRWGEEWRGNDWQHTAMGIVWWCAGLAGIWLSRGRDGSPKRNFIPGFVLILTGWSMSAHTQHSMASSALHTMFGYTLMAAGVTRIIEVSFVLQDKTGVSTAGDEVNSFQYVPVFLLFASGYLFMGATEEQMALLESSPMDHVAYILILYSLAFLTFLFVCMLLHVYDRASYNSNAYKNLTTANTRDDSVTESERRRLQDVEEFELDGLMTDDEDDEEAAKRKLLAKEKDVEGSNSTGPGSPSTVGRNSDRVA